MEAELEPKEPQTDSCSWTDLMLRTDWALGLYLPHVSHSLQLPRLPLLPLDSALPNPLCHPVLMFKVCVASSEHGLRTSK